MNKILISLSLSLFAACDAFADAEELITESPSEVQIDENMRKQAEFSCLKYAAIRLGNEMSLRITQVKPSDPNAEKNIWLVAGNKINPDDPESYKCLGKVNTDRGDYVKALRNYLDDLSLFQVTEESVNELKKAGKAAMKKQADEKKSSEAASDDTLKIPFAPPEEK